jgi:hypothetical protein
MKHTQGKWEPIFEKYSRKPKRICTGVGVNIEVASGTYTEFVCNSMLPDTDKEYIKQQDQIEADMKLIAAAPDMIALVGKLLARDENRNCPFCDKPDWGEENHGINCPFRLAYEIKKATE